MLRILIGLGAIVVAVLAWVLVSPLFIDNVVEEDFPVAAAPATPAAPAAPAARAASAEDIDGTGEDVEMAEVMPTGEPVAVLRGSFRDADAVHRGSGEATLYRLADGRHVLRFEDFRATNGPDLFVWLTSAETPQRSSDVTDAEWVNLGALKGNVGDQNYEIPADVDITQYNNVVIWCRAFSVLFATADFEVIE